MEREIYIYIHIHIHIYVYMYIMYIIYTYIWRGKWQPTPVFLLAESQGWGSLVGCHLWGCKESDTTEVI